MDECKVIIMGFGSVGQGVANAISMKKDLIKDKTGVDIKVVAAADSSSSAISQDGLDEELLVKTKKEEGKLSAYPEFGSDKNGVDVLDAVEYDCLIEATPTNIVDAEPALSLTYKAFEQGKDVVTSNKGHLALKFREVVDAAEKAGVEFKYEATVGGSMPIINFTKETLASCEIKSIKGILNGTTNYILSRMTSEGSEYDVILRESQELGIAETDPTQDVEGIDAACKTVILANSLLGIDATYSDVDVEGISNIITNPGDVNTDFADVRNAMSGQGNAIFGIGVAEGENRAVEAASKAINNPMLENSRIDGAKNLLINICSSEEITLSEVGEITKIVSSSADKDYNMFWGQVTQPELGNKISVTVIATGFEANGNNFVEKKDFVPEPVQKTVDPNVVDNDEFLSILKNTTSSTSSVSSLQTESKSTAKTNEFDFFGSSFNQKTEKNNEETIGAAFAKDDVPNLHLSQASKSIKAREGYVPQGNLNEPAIWSNPDFGRTINLFDD